MGYTKIVKSGDLMEIYQYEKDIIIHRERAVRTRRLGKHTFRRFPNVRRLRKSFIRIVRANVGGQGAPVLLTLTMLEIVPLAIAYREYSEFIRRYRRYFGKEAKYVAVPEFQKRGAVHFHVLFWGLPENVIENEKSGGYRVLQRFWARGYVDCIRTDGSPRLAGYLAKYMSKAVHDPRLLGQKAYVVSRNVLRPVSVSSPSALDLWANEFILGKVPTSQRQFEVKFLGKCDYSMYDLSL